MQRITIKIKDVVNGGSVPGKFCNIFGSIDTVGGVLNYERGHTFSGTLPRRRISALRSHQPVENVSPEKSSTRGKRQS